jgi:ethanolaminephosphotransferase
MLVSGYFGPEIWTMRLKDTLGEYEIFQEYNFMDFWVPFLLGSFLVAHLPSCISNVVSARRRQNLPVWPVFLEWTPMIIFTGSCGLWLYSPYTTLLEESRLVLFCLTMSFVFGRMTTKIILAHLTKQPFPYWTILLAPLMGGAVLANLPYMGL